MLALPISNNYTKGWNLVEMTLDTLKNRTEKKGCTLSEIIHKDHIIKPYVDIDRKVPHAVFQEEDDKSLSYWTDALSPLCSAANLAVCTRSLEVCEKVTKADMQHLHQEFPGADLSKISKISYHFTLNGLKCNADP